MQFCTIYLTKAEEKLLDERQAARFDDKPTCVYCSKPSYVECTMYQICLTLAEVQQFTDAIVMVNWRSEPMCEDCKKSHPWK